MKTNKKLVGAFALLLSLSVFAGDKGGNGGDPFEVNAVEFPDRTKLEEAIELVETRLAAANVADKFRNETIAEMKSLRDAKKYLYLENIILISSWDAPESYRIPNDGKRFLGLGAMTGNKKGALVYFSSRALKHTPEEFSELLLHEVIHHVLPRALSEDEEMVELLARSVMKGDVSEQLNVAVEKGIYIRPGMISPNQMIEYWDKLQLENTTNHQQRDYHGLPASVWDMPLDHVSLKMGQTLLNLQTSDQWGIAKEGYLMITDMLKDLGYGDVSRPFATRFCKKKVSYFGSCKNADRVLMKDLFKK